MENEQYNPTTISDLAKKYKVSNGTIYVWLLPIREELLAMYPVPKRRLRVLLPKQIKRITEFLG